MRVLQELPIPKTTIMRDFGMSHEEGGDAFSAEAVLFVATLRTRIGNIALPEFSEKELV